PRTTAPPHPRNRTKQRRTRASILKKVKNTFYIIVVENFLSTFAAKNLIIVRLRPQEGGESMRPKEKN
ncbi:MAG: hypothetical protein IJ612_06690, partial [Prevotella sp.]|nr:hypothetical protein [Prevotella sp.]